MNIEQPPLKIRAILDQNLVAAHAVAPLKSGLLVEKVAHDLVKGVEAHVQAVDDAPVLADDAQRGEITELACTIDEESFNGFVKIFLYILFARLNFGIHPSLLFIN